jgi:hypothetical protein
MAGKDFNLGGFIFSDAVNLTSGQIAFPAAQSASAGVNTLDDYEEGTFTPTLTSTTGTITTVGTRTGWYTKIGNLVVGAVDITITTNGTGATSLNVAGLPFTAADTYGVNGAEIVGTGKNVNGWMNTGSSTLSAIRFYDATYPGADSRRFVIPFAYKT